MGRKTDTNAGSLEGEKMETECGDITVGGSIKKTNASINHMRREGGCTDPNRPGDIRYYVLYYNGGAVQQ